MTALRDRSCTACPPGTRELEPAAARELLAQLGRAWRITNDGKLLRRSFGFLDFYRTMAFVNAVAWVANDQDHHPDLEVGYNYCRLAFTTHSIGGLSENDFICAAKIDAL